ncbi:MAG: hypothetical protein QXI07_09600 [Pyrobaculum sp.]
MRPPDYELRKYRLIERYLGEGSIWRTTLPTVIAPGPYWTSVGTKTALPPPLQTAFQEIEAARQAAPGAAALLGFTEVTGIPALGRIIYALATGKPYAEAEREYWEQVQKNTVFSKAGYTPEEVRGMVEGAAVQMMVGLAPLMAPALSSRQALMQLLKTSAAGAAVAGVPTAAVATAQGRPLSEVAQMTLDAAVSGAVLGDVAVRGLRALADRLKTAPSADIVSKLKQLRLPDAEISEFMLRRNMELESFRRKIETLSMDELLRLRDKYREMLDAYIRQDASKIRNIREPRWEIEDKLSVLEDVINQRRHFPHDVDLAHAAAVLNPPPRITPRIDANVRSLLQRIARASSPDTLARIEQEIANMPDDVRQFLENAIQKKLMHLRGERWIEMIRKAKTPEELAQIEVQIPDDALKALRAEIDKRLLELKTHSEFSYTTQPPPEPPIVRVEKTEKPAGAGGREVEAGKGTVLIVKEEPEVKPPGQKTRQRTRLRPKLDDTAKQGDVNTAKQADSERPKLDDTAKQGDNQGTKQGDVNTAKQGNQQTAKQDTQITNQYVTTTSVADAITNAITRGELAALGAKLVEAVPAAALLYAVGPGYMLYVSRDGFYVTTGGKTYYIPPPVKPPPSVGGGDGGGFPIWQERRARRLAGEKIRVY